MTDSASNPKRAAILVATVSSFILPFIASSVHVALPSMGPEFAMGLILLGWVNNAYLMACLTFLIPFGRLGDIYGCKKIFTTGYFVLLVASLLIAISHSSTMLIICRALQGLATAIIAATGIPMMISVVPVRERGRALGIVTAAVYFGHSTAPFLGGVITQHLGWRFIFWLIILLSLAILVITHFMLKGDWVEAPGERFDLRGAIILALGLSGTTYGFSTLPSTSAVILIVAGVLGIIFFVIFEMRTVHPILDINLFRHNAIFVFSNLATLINHAATFAVTFLLSFYLQQVKALTPQLTGLVLVAQPMVQAMSSPMTGRLSDRIEPRLLASWGMVFILLGLAMLLFLASDSSVLYVVLCLVILGIGFGLFSSPNANAVMSSVDHQFYGVASATLSTMRQTGNMFSMGIVMLSMPPLLEKSGITPDNCAQFLVSMRISLGIFAVLCFCGIFASLARGNISRVNMNGQIESLPSGDSSHRSQFR
jgi:EmrB/QacA subfamily drug resistance transporter